MLRNSLIDHIKPKSRSKTNTAKQKVYTLFGSIKLSYTKNNGEVLYFMCSQELAKVVAHAIKH